MFLSGQKVVTFVLHMGVKREKKINRGNNKRFGVIILGAFVPPISYNGEGLDSWT